MYGLQRRLGCVAGSNATRLTRQIGNCRPPESAYSSAGSGSHAGTRAATAAGAMARMQVQAAGCGAAILAIGLVEDHELGVRAQRRPAAGVHGPDGRVQAQRVPAQRGGQVQRAGAAGHQAIGGGNEGDELRQAELAGEVGGEEGGVCPEPGGQLLPFGRRAGDEDAMAGLVQQPGQLGEIIEAPLAGAAPAARVQDDVELAGLALLQQLLPIARPAARWAAGAPAGLLRAGWAWR